MNRRQMFQLSVRKNMVKDIRRTMKLVLAGQINDLPQNGRMSMSRSWTSTSPIVAFASCWHFHNQIENLAVELLLTT